MKTATARHPINPHAILVSNPNIPPMMRKIGVRIIPIIYMRDMGM
jgi:hypothetical protein